MGCTLNKFADNTKLGGRHYRGIWTDWVNRLRPLMRFNKITCWVLHLSHKKDMQSYRVGKGWLEICLEKKNLVALVNNSWTWAGVCPGGQRWPKPSWPAGPGQRSSCWTWNWWDCTSNPVFRLRSLTMRKVTAHFLSTQVPAMRDLHHLISRKQVSNPALTREGWSHPC